MTSIRSKTEAMLLVVILALMGAAVLVPPLPDPALHHAFADQRQFWGVLYAANVYSCVPFALGGGAGAIVLWCAPARTFSNMQRAMALLLFSGLVLVALGLAAYHLDPGRATLATARYCLAAAIAGLLGLAAAAHISERAGAALGMGLVALGLASVKWWLVTGNVLPWALFQFGGLLVLWWIASLPLRLRALPVNWALVLLAWGAAKLLELNDQAIWELTRGVVAGHTLSHLVGSMAAWPVVGALATLSRVHQEAREPGIADEVAIRWWRGA